MYNNRNDQKPQSVLVLFPPAATQRMEKVMEKDPRFFITRKRKKRQRLHKKYCIMLFFLRACVRLQLLRVSRKGDAQENVPFVGKHEAVWRRSQRKCWSRGWNAYCTYIILLTLILTRSRTILHGKVVTSCDHHHWQPNPYNSLSTTPSHPQLITSKVDTLIYDDHETALYL